MYVNDFDFDGECAKRGNISEKAFAECALARHYKIRSATHKEQLKHIDFVLKGVNPVSKKEVTVTVDVKGRKKATRKKKSFNDKWVWLEMVNVAGKSGWLMEGANFIAFERVEDFVVAKRVDIQKWVESSGRIRYDLPYVKNGWEAKYRVYRRAGRKDAITLVKMVDIIKFCQHYIWKK